ncbi:MAG: hypothetical protein R6X25_01150 [Candidatus Krumholzibacteriia bacterium]
MKAFLRATTGPDDWRALLADPEQQWRAGYSAHALAHCWEAAGDLPGAVRRMLETEPLFRGFELLLAIPELQVSLPGGGRPSQTDLWVLGSIAGGLVSVAVEGKVSEPFGPTVGEWQRGASHGKITRLDYLCDLLHLRQSSAPRIRYQLLHRTASAIILARRFHAAHAVMLVHSFSPDRVCSQDYRMFAAALGAVAQDGMIVVPSHREPTLSLAWVSDLSPEP